jgi:hypothetical protein
MMAAMRAEKFVTSHVLLAAAPQEQFVSAARASLTDTR